MQCYCRSLVVIGTNDIHVWMHNNTTIIRCFSTVFLQLIITMVTFHGCHGYVSQNILCIIYFHLLNSFCTNSTFSVATGITSLDVRREVLYNGRVLTEQSVNVSLPNLLCILWEDFVEVGTDV